MSNATRNGRLKVVWNPVDPNATMCDRPVKTNRLSELTVRNGVESFGFLRGQKLIGPFYLIGRPYSRRAIDALDLPAEDKALYKDAIDKGRVVYHTENDPTPYFLLPHQRLVRLDSKRRPHLVRIRKRRPNPAVGEPELIRA